MLSDVIEEILKFLFHLLFDIIVFYTGEIGLCVITFGRKKPRWDYYLEERPSRFVVFTSLSEWVGIIFWVLVIIVVRLIIKA